MIKTLTYLTLFSGFSFLFFGLACFLTKNMKLEFERYGLASYRKTVGALQLAGGIVLLAGMYLSPLLQEKISYLIRPEKYHTQGDKYFIQKGEVTIPILF